MVQAVVKDTDAARWQRALDRALAECLDVLIEPISGEAFVESATHPGTLYQVSATSCSCKAGQAGIPCKHRAVYLAQIGELPLEPVPTIIRIPRGFGDDGTDDEPEPCRECRGRGTVYSEYWSAPCRCLEAA